jgi:hypothetical protein
MAQSSSRPSSELGLLQKQADALGELLDNERLERKADLDKLKIELEAIKHTLASLLPEFTHRFLATHAEFVRRYDPEGEKLSKAG